MTKTYFHRMISLVLGTAVALAACSGAPKITTTESVSPSVDTPYQKVLVIALFATDDTRWSFEREVVKQLSEIGTTAVSRTSLEERDTAMTRDTVLAMLEKFDADAVLVTQVADLNSKLEMKDMRPEASYKFGATWYFDVWSVDLREYVEPQQAEVTSSVVLATQLYDVATKEPVWAIEAKSKLIQESGNASYYPYIVEEAKAIVGQMSENGLIAR